MTDQTKYCTEMAKGMDEKLFFLDHINNVHNIIDFGCADGQVTEEIQKPLMQRVIGYDKNPGMLPEHQTLADYYYSWRQLLEATHNPHEGLFQERNAIYFSSVLHEAYSYNEINSIIGKVHSLAPKYIIIRDMYVTDADKMKSIENDRVTEIVGNVNLRLVNHFVCEFGPLMGMGNMIHFLMKHRFAYNWDHEMKEDYLSLTDDDIALWKSFGEVVYQDHSPLPYYQDVFSTRYGFDLEVPTHIKLVIKT